MPHDGRSAAAQDLLQACGSDRITDVAEEETNLQCERTVIARMRVGGDGKTHRGKALAAAIRRCMPPQYWRAASKSCALCPVGKYQPYQGGEACYECQKTEPKGVDAVVSVGWSRFCSYHK